MANETAATLDSTTTSAVTTAASVTDGEVVGGQNEVDNSTLFYPMARCVINVPDNFSTTPDGSIDFYIVEGEVDFNDGTPADDGTALGYAALTTADNITDPEYARYVGSLSPNVDEAYRDVLDIMIPGVRKFKLYIQNNTGATLQYSSGSITVDVTLASWGN